jgi:hypothetical protein
MSTHGSAKKTSRDRLRCTAPLSMIVPRQVTRDPRLTTPQAFSRDQPPIIRRVRAIPQVRKITLCGCHLRKETRQTRAPRTMTMSLDHGAPLCIVKPRRSRHWTYLPSTRLVRQSITETPNRTPLLESGRHIAARSLRPWPTTLPIGNRHLHPRRCKTGVHCLQATMTDRENQPRTPVPWPSV